MEFLLPRTAPIPYIAFTFLLAGMVITETDFLADIASVAYTIAASASPVDTAFSVAAASMPRVIFDSDIATPFRNSTVAAYTPHGAVFAHSEMTEAFGKSATDEMRNGFPGFTINCIEFLANTFGDFTTLPDASNLSKPLKSAAANTSLGAPD